MINLITRDPKKLLYDKEFLGLGSDFSEINARCISFVPDLLTMEPIKLDVIELCALIDILEFEKEGKFSPFEDTYKGNLDWIAVMMNIVENKFVEGHLVQKMGNSTFKLNKTIWNGEFRAEIDEDEPDFETALDRLGFTYQGREINEEVKDLIKSHVYFFNRPFDRDIHALELQRELFVNDREGLMETYLVIESKYGDERFNLIIKQPGIKTDNFVRHIASYFQHLRAGKIYAPNVKEDTVEFDQEKTVEIPVYKP